MEFHEKLQELRKNKGLTQEELAEALFVSRTAISKWESGKGYPSIDSLKSISNYFSVSIDDLLSGDKLLTIAEKEHKSSLQNVCGQLLGIVDICALCLIILPLYPYEINDYVYSVGLYNYVGVAPTLLLLYWIMPATLIATGIIKIIFKNLKFVTMASLIINIIMVFFFALSKEPYATAMAFILLLIKGGIIRYN